MTSHVNLLAMKCCGSCQHFEGPEIKVYRRGLCNADTGRDVPQEKVVWTGTLCWRYSRREMR